MTKNWKNIYSWKNCILKSKIAIYFSPPLGTSKLQEKPSALKIENPALKTLNLLTFFSWVIFALLDLDPDPADQNQCESGIPDRKHFPWEFTEFRGENRTDKISYFPQSAICSMKVLNKFIWIIPSHFVFIAVAKNKLHYCPRPKTLAAWLQLLEEGDFDGLTAGLIAYYDSCYKRPSDTLLR